MTRVCQRCSQRWIIVYGELGEIRAKERIFFKKKIKIYLNMIFFLIKEKKKEMKVRGKFRQNNQFGYFLKFKCL